MTLSTDRPLPLDPRYEEGSHPIPHVSELAARHEVTLPSSATPLRIAFRLAWPGSATSERISFVSAGFISGLALDVESNSLVLRWRTRAAAKCAVRGFPGECLLRSKPGRRKHALRFDRIDSTRPVTIDARPLRAGGAPVVYRHRLEPASLLGIFLSSFPPALHLDRIFGTTHFGHTRRPTVTMGDEGRRLLFVLDQLAPALRKALAANGSFSRKAALFEDLQRCVLLASWMPRGPRRERLEATTAIYVSFFRHEDLSKNRWYEMAQRATWSWTAKRLSFIRPTNFTDAWFRHLADMVQGFTRKAPFLPENQKVVHLDRIPAGSNPVLLLRVHNFTKLLALRVEVNGSSFFVLGEAGRLFANMVTRPFDSNLTRQDVLSTYEAVYPPRHLALTLPRACLRPGTNRVRVTSLARSAKTLYSPFLASLAIVIR